MTMNLTKHRSAALIAGLCLLSFAAAARAQHHEVVSADAIKWGPAPPSLPPGAQAARIMGDPGKPGPFVLRLKFPDGFVVPPHRHSNEEHVSVFAGGFAFGIGEKVDPAVKALPPGSFVRIPAKEAHWARAHGETIVQINGMGPFDVRYVRSGNDPRHKTTKTQ